MEKDKVQYLILSFISGAVELGVILWGIRLGYGVEGIIGLGAAYQLGNLVPNPLRLNKIQCIICELISIFLFLILYCNVAENLYFIYFAAVVLFASGLQWIRNQSKGNASVTVKRLCRILGFSCAPQIGISSILIFTLIVFLFSIMEKYKGGGVCRKYVFTTINYIMIAHQIHYFAYSYFILIIFQKAFSSNIEMVAIIFVLGWLTYILVPHFIKGTKYQYYFIIGHIYLLIVLVLLYLNRGLHAAIFLWIFTGFGGGTVVCLEKIRKQNKLGNKESLELSENIGHILGVIVGLVCYYSFNNVYSPILVSIAAVLCAIGLMLKLIKKLQYHRTGR